MGDGREIRARLFEGEETGGEWFRGWYELRSLTGGGPEEARGSSWGPCAGVFGGATATRSRDTISSSHLG